MHLARLRLTGFKSFVDPTDLLIEPGLTGIVGPNGCGKSNLVEALRWVMGETSARLMRGGEMDDVIFGGTTSRPPRNIAEVSIHIDNSDRRAPAHFNDASEIEITRRIERTKGSAYRINGRETRARDVQLLFADVATGARSTGLVSQGRIGAMIAAKPPERRALLEEAAGITGLHSRRHEAELRLRAADENLRRLDDVLAALDTQLQGLRKQARQATRYRQLAEQIRRAESVLLHRRWEAATAARGEAAARLAEAEVRVAELTGRAAHAAAAQADAEAGLPALRQAEAEAGAAVQRLVLAERELEAEGRRVEQAKREAEQRLVQITADLEREGTLAEDARTALARLDGERAVLATQQDGEAEAQAESQRTLADANRAADATETGLARLTERIAGSEARRAALERQRRELTDRVERLVRQQADLEAQHARVAQEAPPAEELQGADAALAAAEQALAQARAAAETAAAERSAAAGQESEARRALAGAEAALAKLQAEADALTAVLRVEDSDRPGVLDSLQVEPGYEAALGAALGEDLSAPALDDEAPVRWRTLPPLVAAPVLPDGVEPLGSRVAAPPALARRLAQIGVAGDVAAAASAQDALRPGQRLVTRDGGLWRWDGYTVAPGAPTAAATRLAQRNRLAALAGEREAAEAARAEAAAEADRATQAVDAAGRAEEEARRAVDAAFSRTDEARRRQSALASRQAAIESRLAGLLESRERLGAEAGEARQRHGETEAQIAQLDDVAELRRQATEMRSTLDERRSALVEARSHHDRLLREAEARRSRLAALDAEARSWRERGERAAARLAELAARKESESAEIARLADLPGEIARRRSRLLDEIETAEATRRQATEALGAAELRLAEAVRELRQAEAAVAEAREARVRAEAGVEQADQALAAVRERIAERLETTPERVLEAAEIGADEVLPDAEAMAARLERLTRERDNIGPVNLRAEQEVTELEAQVASLVAEREDLTQAIQRLRTAIGQLNREGRERLTAAVEKVNQHFEDLFVRLFGGGTAHLALTEAEDPLEAGVEIMASPPGKKLQMLSLLSGGEQALTALALIFAVFLTNPAPVCVLDEVDAPLDDANVDRFCTLLDDIAEQTSTRFLIITHHRMTMARMNRLFGVTMAERGISQLVSVDLEQAERLRESAA